VDQALDELARRDVVRRIWAHDGSLWSADPAVQALARERLGWLQTPEIARGQLPDLRAFVQGLVQEGFTHAVVLGMGGSSLAPAVLRDTFGTASRFLRLEVLDSTDPEAVLDLEERIDPAHTLFIVASKSGTTTEALAFLAYFWQKAPHGGRQFIAITDPGSPLEREALARGFRRVFPHQPDVGGRYAALTYIGLVPAACLGVDLDGLVERAGSMARRCRLEGAANPGLWLGAALAAAARQGRDKLTLICSPEIGSFGTWVEQLVAESTGKSGTGIVPVEGEPLGPPNVYGGDRRFVYLRLDGAADLAQDAAVERLQAAGHPVVHVHLQDRLDLGAEFFRWEFTVPVASVLLGVEPFDQPNVQESKDNTDRLLRRFLAEGRLPADPPLLREAGIALVAHGRAAHAINEIHAASLAAALRAFFGLVRPGDYLALTAYLAPTPARQALLQQLRVRLRDQLRVATTLGYGPRYLHSTGQLHKGGPDTGVFVQLVSEPLRDIDVPGMGYTFQTLKMAQALGDLEALEARGRRLIRLDLGADVDGALQRLLEAVAEALA
jgi:transaldolase/glucose-6-phosphate isomerase